MYIASLFYLLIAVFYSSVIFCADSGSFFIPSPKQYRNLKKSNNNTNTTQDAKTDNNHILTLPSDTWIPIFNCLPLKDQYHLALTCKAYKEVFDFKNDSIKTSYSIPLASQNITN